MRRVFLVSTASATLGLALLGPVQASLGAPVAHRAASAAKASKGTRYHINVYDEFGTLAAEYTGYLVAKTHTWSVEGRCDGGKYKQSGKSLTLEDACSSETIYLERVKHKKGVYYGFGAYAFFEFIRE